MTPTRQTIETAGSAFDSPEWWAESDTHCTIIAGEVVERNILRMADYCRPHGIDLRPHMKTHKAQRIAQLQLDAGAIGFCVLQLCSLESDSMTTSTYAKSHGLGQRRPYSFF